MTSTEKQPQQSPPPMETILVVIHVDPYAQLTAFRVLKDNLPMMSGDVEPLFMAKMLMQPIYLLFVAHNSRAKLDDFLTRIVTIVPQVQGYGIFPIFPFKPLFPAKILHDYDSAQDYRDHLALLTVDAGEVNLEQLEQTLLKPLLPGIEPVLIGMGKVKQKFWVYYLFSADSLEVLDGFYCSVAAQVRQRKDAEAGMLVSLTSFLPIEAIQRRWSFAETAPRFDAFKDVWVAFNKKSKEEQHEEKKTDDKPTNL